jgi:putative oxidoreductase
MRSKAWFSLGAIISLAIALLHVVIIFIGPEAYRYFGAGEEMATMAEKGSFYPALVTTFVALVFSIFGLYALSAAGILKKFPFTKVVVVIITTIYLLRGFGFVIEVTGIIYGYEVPLRHAVFSFVALSTGVVHLIALIKGWKNL